MKKILSILILSAIFIMIFSTAVWAIDIRALLVRYSNSITFNVEKGDYSLMDRSIDFPIKVCEVGDTITVTPQGNFLQVTVNNRDLGSFTGPVVLKTTDMNSLFRYNGTKYRGSFTVQQSSSKLIGVNTLNIECYLYGVVGKEIGTSTHMDALKAQAVCSRSYAAANRKANSNYDVTATTSSQVYGGYTAELATNGNRVVEAVDATRGEVLSYNGKIIPAYFSANAGGYTEKIENIWGPSTQGAPFYAMPSPGDATTSSYSWTKTLTAADLTSLANKYGKTNIGTFQEMRLYRTDDNGTSIESGRVYKVEIIGTADTVTAYRDSIRFALGGLRSTLFSVEGSSGGGSSSVWVKGVSTNAMQVTEMGSLYAMGSDKVTRSADGGSGQLYVVTSSGKKKVSQTVSASEILTGNTFVLNGNGYGHGVGMSQHGAMAMAKDGATYEQIISYYFMNNGKDKNYSLEII